MAHRGINQACGDETAMKSRNHIQRINWHRDRFLKRDGCVEKKCSVCGKDFYLPPSKAENRHRCSAECNKKHIEMIKKEKQKICPVCGKTFHARNAQINRGGLIFCGHKCQGVYQSGQNNPMFGKAITEQQRAKWRATRDANGSWFIGEKNPNWNGGYRASYERKKASGVLAVYCQNRRKRAKENGGKLSKEIVQKLLILQKRKCACCGEPLGNKYHIDHIVPLFLGGKNEDSNVQLLRQRCNQQKSFKDPIDFMQSKGFLL
jgi:5-methylcytosine-specific restriction endonuclease McrA